MDELTVRWNCTAGESRILFFRRCKGGVATHRGKPRLPCCPHSPPQRPNPDNEHTNDALRRNALHCATQGLPRPGSY